MRILFWGMYMSLKEGVDISEGFYFLKEETLNVGVSSGIASLFLFAWNLLVHGQRKYEGELRVGVVDEMMEYLLVLKTKYYKNVFKPNYCFGHIQAYDNEEFQEFLRQLILLFFCFEYLDLNSEPLLRLIYHSQKLIGCSLDLNKLTLLRLFTHSERIFSELS